MEWVADVVEEANKLLKDDRHAAIGPSYFMKDGLNDAMVERVWKHSVLPYVEERRFGEVSKSPRRVRAWRRLKGGIASGRLRQLWTMATIQSAVTMATRTDAQQLDLTGV